MPLVDFDSIAEAASDDWKSSIVGAVGSARIKVLMFLVEAGVAHSVLAASHGTLVIIDL